MSRNPIESLGVADARVLARVWEGTEQALVPIDAAAITRAAISASTGRPGVLGWWRRAWPAGSARATEHPERRNLSMLTATRLAVFAAILALGSGAVLFAGGGAPDPVTVATPSPSPSPALTMEAFAPGVEQVEFRAIVVRPVAGGVDVIIAGADGQERLLRHLTPADLGIDPRYTLGAYGTGQRSNQQGWLELWAVGGGDDRTGLARWGLMVLVDLADPSKSPIILPANGFMSGQWGPDGQYALFCSEPPDCGQPTHAKASIDAGAVRVFEPDLGTASAIILPRVQAFGGGPEIFWTADGSGFLRHDGNEWGVTPLDGGPFRPGAPKLLTSELDRLIRLPEDLDLLQSGLDDPDGWMLPNDPDAFGDGGLAAATHVDAKLTADREAVWQLLDDPVGPSPRAILARLTGPDTVESVHAIDLPAGPAVWFMLSPDDTFVAIYLQDHSGASGGWGDFVLAPVGVADAAVTAGPAIDGILAGLVPAAIADAWLGQ